MWEMFEIRNFMPYGHSFLWRSDVLWMHVVSDFVIALAYFTVPIIFFRLYRRSKDFRMKWFFASFGAFIFFSGINHIFNIVTMWVPIYQISGVAKAITAAVSIATAAMYLPLLNLIFNNLNVDELDE